MNTYKILNFPISFRSLCLLGCIASLFLLGCAYIIQYSYKIEPCPLCLIQRYVFIVIAFLFALAALHKPQNSKVRFSYIGLILFFSILGIVLAARHVWLQYLPQPEVATCGGGLERMLAFMPFLEVLQEVFDASPACSQIDFTILHLSIPVWTLSAFIGFLIFAGLILILQIKRRI
jgi:disulfide bond formation protein DsbB